MKKYGLPIGGIFLLALAFRFYGKKQISPTIVGGAATIPMSLDQLFSGIEKGCSGNPLLKRALSSMASPLPEYQGWRVNRTMELPASLGSHFGEPRITEEYPEYTVIKVTVTDATFHGFAVEELKQWLGHGNGVNGFSFVLSGSPDEVGGKLEGELKIIDSCQVDPHCVQPFVMKLSPLEGRTQVICDTSM